MQQFPLEYLVLDGWRFTVFEYVSFVYVLKLPCVGIAVAW